MSATYQTIKTQALADLEAATLDPKPTYSIDGQRVEHGEYLGHLQKLIDWCDAKLAQGAPCEIETQAGHP